MDILAEQASNQHTFNREIVSNQHSIIKKLEQIMNAQERFDAVLARIDASTSAIAARINKFLDEVKTGTVSDASIASLEKDADALDALGKPDDAGTGTGTGDTGTGTGDTGTGDTGTGTGAGEPPVVVDGTTPV
jgi:hypothetical protein